MSHSPANLNVKPPASVLHPHTIPARPLLRYTVSTNHDRSFNGSVQTLVGSAVPPGWTALGCFTDSLIDQQRMLFDFMERTQNNTLASCTTICAKNAFTFAGLTAGDSCWCSNKMTITAPFGQLQPDSDCSIPCAGDASQTCGAASLIQIFNTTTSALPTATNSSSTLKASATSVPDPPRGWSSVGCFSDSPQQRVLSAYEILSQTMTPGVCTSICGAKHYEFAGVELASNCWCAQNITMAGTTGLREPDSECSMPCTGDSFQRCGGTNRMKIYHITNSTKAANDKSKNTPNNNNSNNNNNNKKPSMNGAVPAVIVIAVLIVISLVAASLYFIFRGRRRVLKDQAPVSFDLDAEEKGQSSLPYDLRPPPPVILGGGGEKTDRTLVVGGDPVPVFVKLPIPNPNRRRPTRTTTRANDTSTASVPPDYVP